MRSIRWQLPLSYAAIALLAALAIGALMLARLNEYYTQRERDFLQNNASAIQSSLMPLSLAELPPGLLQAQVESMAVFARSRVRLYDNEENLIADSGEISAALGEIRFLSLPDGMIATQGIVGATDIIFVDNGSGSVGVTSGTSQTGLDVYTGTLTNGTNIIFGQSGQPYATDSVMTAALPVFSIFPASYLGEEDFSSGRSAQSVEVLWLDGSGRSTGRIVLSEGPAYGREIVNSAAQAWLIAGTAGVLLAALAGWLVSRRMSQPVLALAQVTGRMAQGDLAARAGTFTVTEFDHLGRAFNQMAEQVEGTVATLRTFAADAAHELKTPLTALRTNLELAQTTPQTGRQVEFLNRSQAQVRQLEHLVTDLLDLARLESGSLQRQTLDLGPFLRQISEGFASRAEQSGLSFELELPDTDLSLQADPIQLEMAVGNLLDNAIKFTPPGGEVRLGAQRLEEKQGVLIWVEDSGVGVLPEDEAQLFGRFHRGRNASGTPGSGLGLAIVRAVAAAHGGEARASNRPLGGARFEIILP